MQEWVWSTISYVMRELRRHWANNSESVPAEEGNPLFFSLVGCLSPGVRNESDDVSRGWTGVRVTYSAIKNGLTQKKN